MPGPPPKRSTERRRRNKANTETVHVTGNVDVPPCPDDLHRVARDWYESLKHSGQATFYQPSDWAEAIVAAEVLSNYMESTRRSSETLKAWTALADRLLTTEAARRRVRMEIENPQGEQEEKPTKLAEYKKRRASSE